MTELLTPAQKRILTAALLQAANGGCTLTKTLEEIACGVEEHIGRTVTPNTLSRMVRQMGLLLKPRTNKGAADRPQAICQCLLPIYDSLNELLRKLGEEELASDIRVELANMANRRSPKKGLESKERTA